MKMLNLGRLKRFTVLMFALLGIQVAIATIVYADDQAPKTAIVEAVPSSATNSAVSSANDAAAKADSENEVLAPEVTIEKFHAGLLDIMQRADVLGIQGRIDILAPLMNKTFDLEFMASKTVGRHWRKLSDEDKARWVKMFKRFTTTNYAGRFTGFTGEEFVTIGVKDAPRGTRIVLTKIIVPDDDDVELNYRMIKRGQSWQVIDVFLNGTVSELALRRSEYSSALKRNGFPKLLESVEAKIADLKAKALAEG